MYVVGAVVFLFRYLKANPNDGDAHGLVGKLIGNDDPSKALASFALATLA